VNVVEEDPESFAFNYLNEQPRDVNVVQTEKEDKPKKRRGGKNKLSKFSYVQLSLLCLMATFLITDATPAVISNQPMVCGSHQTDLPHLFDISRTFTCTNNDTADPKLVPQNSTIMVYKPNLILWESPAYQCKKFTTIIETQISFFTDIKEKTVSSSDRVVTQGECLDMIRYKECRDGKLKGGNGVYLTDNKIDAKYVHCCKKHSFSADQCSIIEASVYAKHGSGEMESTAGDVSHCNYKDLHCQLSDGSILIWEANENVYCKEEEWYEVEGTFYDLHFVSKDRGMAFTFTQHGMGSAKDCDGNVTSVTDQGLMVRFLTPLINTTIRDNIVDKYSLQGEFSAVINSVAQAIVHEQTQLAQKLFWSSYYYSCHNAAQMISIITMLLEQHPTMAARYMLQMTNIVANSGPGYLEVFPCTEIAPDMYELLPMPEGNCTNYIPIKLNMGGSETQGFLNPVDNIIHADTYNVNCERVNGSLIRLNGTLMSYYTNGSLQQIPAPTELTIPNLHLGAAPLKIHETVFSRAHRLNWADFSYHISLNSILSTLSRQSQVLKAMGIVNTPHNTVEENKVKSQERLLGKTFFSFLFGGHVASVYELWTLASNIIVTCTVLTVTFHLLYRLCRAKLCPRRSTPLVAEVQYRGDIQQTGKNCLDGEPDNEVYAPSNPTERDRLTEQNNLYPNLDQVRWPSWYNPAQQ